MSSRWSEEVDEILGGDQLVAFAYATPAQGVVLTPLTNFALRDRTAGTITAVNTSVGTWKKLERVRRNPRVALAYHTRLHGFSERSEFVLVQGTASLRPAEPDYPHAIRESWERFGGSVDFGPVWRWLLRVWLCRVAIEVNVERVTVWPDLGCTGAPRVHGLEPPAKPPPPQRPPAKGTGPRVNHRRAARRAARLPHVLIGWIGGDGYPVVAPVGVTGPDARGIALEAPDGIVVPRGGRRAGLTAHTFSRYTYGQELRKHTGWLEADPARGELVYAPHTETGYRLPESRTLFLTVAGIATRAGLVQARRRGIDPVKLATSSRV